MDGDTCGYCARMEQLEQDALKVEGESEEEDAE